MIKLRIRKKVENASWPSLIARGSLFPRFRSIRLIEFESPELTARESAFSGPKERFCMFVSGVVVSCRPEHAHAVEAAIAGVPNAEIYQRDAESGRFVVVISEDSIEAETDRFEALRKLPDVIDVSLVVHRELEADDAPVESEAPAAQPS